MTDRARAAAMERRIVRTALGLGLATPAVDRLSRAFAVGMEPRVARPLDDHHPDFLHPARTALILMDDARASDPELLAAALVTETRDPTLRQRAEANRALGVPVAAMVEQVVAAAEAGERTLEALLALPASAGLLAVAERLDHARHLHLRPRPEWRPYHAATREAYLPVATRVDPTLARRLEWWGATFADRFLDT